MRKVCWIIGASSGIGEALVSKFYEENYDLAIRVLHFSPEPRVAQRAIECLKLLGRNQDADRLSKHLKMPTLNPPNQTIDNQDLHKLFNFH